MHNTMESTMKKIIIHTVCVFLIFILITAGFYGVSRASEEGNPTYVGTATCKECHDAEYENFKAYAKKATSYQSIKKMQIK